MIIKIPEMLAHPFEFQTILDAIELEWRFFFEYHLLLLAIWAKILLGGMPSE